MESKVEAEQVNTNFLQVSIDKKHFLSTILSSINLPVSCQQFIEAFFSIIIEIGFQLNNDHRISKGSLLLILGDKHSVRFLWTVQQWFFGVIVMCVKLSNVLANMVHYLIPVQLVDIFFLIPHFLPCFIQDILKCLINWNCSCGAILINPLFN